MQSAPSTIICSGSACCFRLLHAYRRMHPPDAAIREAYRSPRLGSSAAPAWAVRPASLTPAVHTPQGRCCATKTAPRHACHTCSHRTPLIRVNCADAAAVAALLHAFSDCACLLVVLWHPLHWYCGCCGAAAAPYLFDTAFKLTAASTATLVLASPRLAAESALNKTLQLNRIVDTRNFHFNFMPSKECWIVLWII